MGKIRYQLADNNSVEEIHSVVVHKIRMGDVEDPDLMVAEPIWKWQQTDAGKFVMKNAVPESPKWERYLTDQYIGWTYAIIAELEAKKLAEYFLKWGNCENNP
jgi:hypothetical protein